MVDNTNQKKVDPAEYLQNLKMDSLKRKKSQDTNKTASKVKESLMGKRPGRSSGKKIKTSREDDGQFRAQQPNIDWEKSKVIPGMFKPVPEKDLLVWKAPSRPFKRRNKQALNSMVMVGVLIGLICLFIGMPFASFVIAAVVVLTYAISTRPPLDLEYKITTHGIKLEDNTYYWYQLGNFWFEKKYNDILVHINTSKFPGRISLVLGKLTKAQARAILSEALLEHKPDPTTYEKASKWLSKIVPLE